MSETDRTPQDLSRQVISLAREIDRLPPGQKYVIYFEKPRIKSLPWEVTITLE